jgi:NAD(P)-dependent dehydrogenase (short-subunit alcohol dehydrogenase family)
MFNQEVAIVTGGAQGIGKAIAKHLLTLNARVIIVDKDIEAGKETESEFQQNGDIVFVQTDVTQATEVEHVINVTLQKFNRIDFLVNNAGFIIVKPITKLTLAEWQQVLATNLTAAFLFAKYAAPYLQKSKGAIVNIASTRAMMSEPNTESYAAAKGGLVALTHALATSLGPDVRANCICPGWIDVSEWKKSSVRHPATLSEADHEQHLVGRVGKPEDIASMVAYLLSPQAAFITGSNFVIDGGMTRKMIYV